MNKQLQVKVEEGILEGKLTENGQVRVFKGVPYAAAPVGELRWRLPQPHASWEGVRFAKYYSNANMHVRPSMNSFYGKEFDSCEYPISEDCLFLNIWAPLAEKADKCPVAVWFHGGDAHANKAIFDGSHFAEEGVITMTVGFRTGVFSGFCHPDLSKEAEEETGHYTSGNYGLYDQIAAIHWVRKNISAFGGDPERITVFGQSAGGTVVQRLISTPLLAGELFGGIMQSAGGLDPRYMTTEISLTEGEEYGRKLLEERGISNIEKARKIDAEIIMKYFSGGPELNMKYFCPKPDGWALPDTPERISLKGQISENIHLMLGTTKHEGFAYGGPKPTLASLENWAKKLFGDRWQEYWKAADPKSEALADSINKQNNGDVKLATCYSWVQTQNALGKPAPYVYLLTRENPGPEGAGAFHSGEHAYVFRNMDKVPWRPYQACDYQLADIISTYWRNFFFTGDPNGQGLPTWEASRDMKSDPWIMELGLRVGMMRPPMTRTAEFMKDFILQYYRDL